MYTIGHTVLSKREKILRRLEIAVAGGLVLAFFLGLWAARTQGALADKLTRLQVVAHSDDPADQALKLAVRDDILALTRTLTADCADAAEADEVLAGRLPLLQAAAQERVYAAGRVCPVAVRLERLYYPTRYYGTFALPAGEYTALRVILGEGAGQNWWCVAFPSLCVAAAESDFDRSARDAGLTDSELRLITARGEEVQLRFWIVDIFARLRHRMSG